MEKSKICGLKRNKLLIRPNEGYFVECCSLTQAPITTNFVQHLPAEISNGDHYLAAYFDVCCEIADDIDGSTSRNEDECSSRPGTPPSQPAADPDNLYFYVITGDSCRQFESFDPNSRITKEFKLHSECQGSQFYLAKGGDFYIIQRTRYLIVKNISENGYTTGEAHQRVLPEIYQNATHFFATEEYFYILKRNEDGQLEQLTTKTLENIDPRKVKVQPFTSDFLISDEIPQPRIYPGKTADSYTENYTLDSGMHNML